MNIKPILFSGPMVRALLDGSKTQTRRVMKPQPHEDGESLIWQKRGMWDAKPDAVHPPPYGWNLRATLPFHVCPYGQPGDLLTVRETWQYSNWTEDGYPFIGYQADESRALIDRGLTDEWSERLNDIWAELSDPENYDIDGRAADRRWRPSIHMPRWASRLTLRITDVRVQRLQGISEADCCAEGMGSPITRDCKKPKYAALWDEINGPGAWGTNPFVWAITFEVITANVDQVRA